MQAIFYNVFVCRDVPIPKRDGINLLSNIYQPAKDGYPIDLPFPIILVRTIYNKDEAHTTQLDPEYFFKRHFNVIFQEVRGRYKSEGKYYHGINERGDGNDTIEFIAKQKWSDWKVVMTVISYLAAM